MGMLLNLSSTAILAYIYTFLVEGQLQGEMAVPLTDCPPGVDVAIPRHTKLSYIGVS